MFSFVTLTTLGYGDISPLTPAARSLAILEATTGVLFVATTIAGIVGIYASQGNSNDQPASSYVSPTGEVKDGER